MSSLFHGKRPPLTPEVGSVESEVGEKNVDCRRGDGGNAEAPQQPRELKANKKRIARYNSAMGSERASSVRQRYAGKICCQCSSLLHIGAANGCVIAAVVRAGSAFTCSSCSGRVGIASSMRRT